MTKWILIAAGGATGSLFRYAIQGWIQRLAGGTFPFGTFGVNIIGCALIGFLTALFTGPVLIREEYRVALTIGILGGFTTFSTFGLETFNLASSSQYALALVNIVLSCGLGVAAVWAGVRAAQYLYGV